MQVAVRQHLIDGDGDGATEGVIGVCATFATKGVIAGNIHVGAGIAQ
ncbi:Uncharacterised protein [Yersinia enterocolitica]|nr:Uncharacterised protein [Yersinia enterocolitica]